MKKFKKQHRFNIIDVLVALVALFLVVHFIGVFRENKSAEELSSAEISYVLELKKVDRNYLDNIRVGNAVFEDLTGVRIGEVVASDALPASMIVTNKATGNTYVSLYPQSDTYSSTEGDTLEYDFYDIRLTVTADTKRTELGFAIGDILILSGVEYTIRLPEFTGVATCVGVYEDGNA